MTRWWTCLLLASCNQVFDLKPTALPPPDAPPMCPQSGPPAFSRRLVQVIRAPCSSYTFSPVTGRALASCGIRVAPYYEIQEGPIDSPLELVPSFVHPAGLQLTEPRLSADGSEAWLVASTSTTPPPPVLSVFHRISDGVWSYDRDLSLGGGALAQLVARYDTPAGRRALIQIDPRSATSSLVELADDGSGTWTTEIRTTTAADLGVDDVDTFGASPDARRIVFKGSRGGKPHIFYTDRSALDAPFSTPAVELANVPITDGIYTMTSDCSRLYFSALASVFYSLP